MTTSVPSRRASRIHVLPESTLGWWAVGSGVLGIALTLAWQLMPFGAWPGFVAQLTGGVLALVAIIRKRDRALTVYVSVMPMLFVIWFVAVELLSLAGVLPEH
jgi:hypothetical protein